MEVGTTRGIVEVLTDEGITGIGETYGGNAVEHGIETAKPFVLGLDPLETGVLHHRLGVFRIGYETAVPAVVRGGIEMACLDAAGKALGRPVYSLLGGNCATGSKRRLTCSIGTKAMMAKSAAKIVRKPCWTGPRS